MSSESAGPALEMKREVKGKFASALWMARLELLGLWRDKRAMFGALVLPFLVYPLMFLGQSKLNQATEEGLNDRELVFQSDLEALPADLRSEITELLSGEGTFNELRDLDSTELIALLRAEDDESVLGEARSALEDEASALVVATQESDDRYELHLFRDGSSDLGNEAVGRLRETLRPLRKRMAAERLIELFGSDPAAGLEPRVVDVAAEDDARGAKVGRFLPLLAVFIVLAGGSLAALAAFAGERENGTMETLLVQPAPAMGLVQGKLIAIVVAGLATTAANGLAFALCGKLGVADGLFPDGGLPLGRLALGILLFVPAVLLLCAALAWVSSRASSFKDGQHALLPLNLVCLLPAALAMQPSAQLGYAFGLLPIAGPALALREALTGTLRAGPAAFTFAAGMVWTVLALRAVAARLDAERLLSSSSAEEELKNSGLYDARRATRIAVITVIVFYVLGGWLQAQSMLPGMIASIGGILTIAAILIARGSHLRRAAGFLAAMGLTRPRLAHLLGALLCAPFLIAFVEDFSEWQQRLLPMPKSFTEAMTPAILEELPLWALIALFAVLPGIFEELFFRGALLSSQRRGFGILRCLGWQGLLFGLAHASVFRLPITAGLGILLAAITLRSRSVLPAMALHMTYNGTLTYLARKSSEEAERLGQENLDTLLAAPWITSEAGKMTAIGLAALGIALFAAVRAPRELSRSGDSDYIA